MLGDCDGVYNTLGDKISGNFEWYRAESSVVVGAVFVAVFFGVRFQNVGGDASKKVSL